MSIAYIRLARVPLKMRKNTHRYGKLLPVPMWTVSPFKTQSVSFALAIWRPDQPSLMF
jgi:hypothetical protein